MSIFFLIIVTVVCVGVVYDIGHDVWIALDYLNGLQHLEMPCTDPEGGGTGGPDPLKITNL